MQRRIKRNLKSKREQIEKILYEQNISPQLKAAFLRAYDAAHQA